MSLIIGSQRPFVLSERCFCCVLFATSVFLNCPSSNQHENAVSASNEFLAAFPQALHSLRDEAREITQLHERAAYAPIPPDEDILDRLRKFWSTYERARKRVLK